MRLDEIEDGWYYLFTKDTQQVSQKFTKGEVHYLQTFDDYVMRLRTQEHITPNMVLIAISMVASLDPSKHHELTPNEPEMA